MATKSIVFIGAYSALSLLFVLLIKSESVGGQVPGDPEQRWDAFTRYTTTYGFPCISPCERRDRNFYWCYVTDSRHGWFDAHGAWAHCSPQPGLDYRGNTCVSDCREHYTGYFWCYTDQEKSWNYCGRTIRAPEPGVIARHKTRFGKYCLTKCENAGHDYSWCSLADGEWDYCSSEPGYDVNGRRCADKCEHRGEEYTWCHLEDDVGGWNYCGTTEIDTETAYTYLGTKCVTPCELKKEFDVSGSSSNNKTNTNVCMDAARVERACSRVPGLAVDNKKCVGNCSTSGGQGKTESYNWCYTDSRRSEVSKCSNVKEDARRENRRPLDSRWEKEREQYPKHGIRRELTKSGSLENIYLYRDEQGINEVTFFEVLRRRGTNQLYSIRYDAEMQDLFMECLEDWNKKGYVISEQLGTTTKLASAGSQRRGVRLDQEGFLNPGGEEYIKLQMIVNGLTRQQSGGRSTAMAEVDVPKNVAMRNKKQVVDALLRSLNEGYVVHVGFFGYDYVENSSSRSYG